VTDNSHDHFVACRGQHLAHRGAGEKHNSGSLPSSGSGLASVCVSSGVSGRR
jgi:hypothetical protein